MVQAVDEAFKHDIDHDDSLDVMLGSPYSDLIDIVAESARGSIFDNTEEEELLC